MDEQELDKQFEATEYDKEGNVVTLYAQPQAAKKKRVTMADLKKQLEELEELVEVDTYAWLDKLDSKIRHIDGTGKSTITHIKHNRTL
jgi:hypothetical protein